MSITTFYSMFELASLNGVGELLSTMWIEAILACVTTTVVFVCSTAKKKQTSAKSVMSGWATAGVNEGPHAAVFNEAAKALRQGRLSDAVEVLRKVSHGLPAHVAGRLLLVAVKAENPEDAVKHLLSLEANFPPEALENAAADALSQNDPTASLRLYKVACQLAMQISKRAWKILAKGCGRDVDILRTLVEEAGEPLSKNVAEAVLEVCSLLKDADLEAEIFEKVSKTDAPALRAFLENAQAGSPARSKSSSQKDVMAAARTIRSHGKAGDLNAAMDAFERARRMRLTSTLLYNSILDASLDCGDLKRGASYFKQAREQGLVDAVSYNMLMKGHLAQNDVKAAEVLLAELVKSKITPTAASYNGILAHRISSGDRKGAWRMVREMRASGVVPGAVTCSILLRGSEVTACEVNRVMELMDSSEEEIDEVLFTCIVDACVRTGSLEVLAERKAQYMSKGNRAALSAPTYGSMIKAYGLARDVQNVRSLWKEMARIGVQPTAITSGCMIEALVANKASMEAWQIVNQMWNDESLRPLVNAITYSTVLKGFAISRQSKQVMEVYDEMRSRGVQPNTITYNTILNAFAQCSAMDYVPALLQDMRNADPPVEPDLVTYSTLIKGFCATGDLDRALQILKELKVDSKFTPDEVMYNSLLDGCAKEHRLDDALRLMDDMKKRGVAPSNYTLSMLVKLMGRCRRLHQAFNLIDTLSKQHNFKVNIQVYTCLMQACFKNRQVAKAISLHDQLLREGLRPDEKLYSVLVLGCMRAGAVEEVLRLIRCAYHLPGSGVPESPAGKRITPPGVDAKLLSDLPNRIPADKASTLFADLAAAGYRVKPSSTNGARRGRPQKETPPPCPVEVGSSASTSEGVAEDAASESTTD